MQIITDKAGWREAITRQGRYDFYHTYEYHALHNNGEPLLFVFHLMRHKLFGQIDALGVTESQLPILLANDSVRRLFENPREPRMRKRYAAW